MRTSSLVKRDVVMGNVEESYAQVTPIDFGVYESMNKGHVPSLLSICARYVGTNINKYMLSPLTDVRTKSETTVAQIPSELYSLSVDAQGNRIPVIIPDDLRLTLTMYVQKCAKCRSSGTKNGEIEYYNSTSCINEKKANKLRYYNVVLHGNKSLALKVNVCVCDRCMQGRLVYNNTPVRMKVKKMMHVEQLPILYYGLQSCMVSEHWLTTMMGKPGAKLMFNKIAKA